MADMPAGTRIPSCRSQRHLVERILGKALIYLTLTGLSLLSILPLLWMFASSLMPLAQIGRWPPEWLPNPVMWENYGKALHFWRFADGLRNTLLVTAFTMLGHLLSSALVAYGFARLRFPGRDLLFVVLLSTMMLPFAVTMVPLFLFFHRLGWINTFLPLIVPAYFGSPFYVFLLRQFFTTIPQEITDAARIDGAPEGTIWWRVILPLAKPAVIVVAIFSFQGAWNDFMGPLIYINDERLNTLALGLYRFRAMPGQGSLFNEMMAASTLMVVPMLAVFGLFQRQFVQGVVLSGIKG